MYIINQSYRFEGYWAFPANKSYWFSGVLEYSPKEEKIELRMWGTQKSKKLDFNSDTVLGLTTDNIKITLLNCIIRSSSKRIHGGKSCKKTILHIIEACKVIIGEHYDNSYDINYSHISARFSEQYDFIQKDGFQHDISRENINVTYKAPDAIVICSNESIRIEINFFGMPGPSIFSLNKFSIVQFEYFDIIFKENHNLEFLLKEINFLKYLIIFSINKNVDLIECSFQEINHSEKSKQSEIFLLDSSFFKRKKRDFPYQIHQNLIDIDDFLKIHNLYENWRKICNEKESAIYKYFTILYDDGYFLEERFQKTVMAFEDYHRNSKSFPQTIRTKKGKERNINLKERIDCIFEEFERELNYLFKDVGEKKRIINLIVDTRDYLTHGGNVKKSLSIKDPTGYFKLTDLLISIIALMILKDIGFTEDEIRNKIWNLPNYYVLVDYDWSNVL